MKAKTVKAVFEHINSIRSIQLKAACFNLTDDHGDFNDFWAWPAAIGMHHAYEGGLAVHTLEVTDTALHIAALYPETDKDVLIAACLWHDVAKIREYALVPTYAALNSQTKHLPRNGGYKGTPLPEDECWIYNGSYAKQIGHIPGSAILFAQAAASNGVDRDTIDAVTHAILAHHGPVRDWGSPVPPQTIEALILHQADMLSAKHGATKGGAL